MPREPMSMGPCTVCGREDAHVMHGGPATFCLVCGAVEAHANHHADNRRALVYRAQRHDYVPAVRCMECGEPHRQRDSFGVWDGVRLVGYVCGLCDVTREAVPA